MNLGCRFLPASSQDLADLGWDYVDIVLVTGDAYVDHPSFGVALIGRWLEANGYRVAILAQPDYHNPDVFMSFGRPRLYFGVSSGNLDSIVANYTGNARVRRTDAYSPEGNPYFSLQHERKNRRRPDRATIRYSQLIRQLFGDVPIVLGGIEASLRRFIHYDYQQERLRSSVLTDAKADLIVYGMGELAALNIARYIEKGRDLTGIDGTCERLTDKDLHARNLHLTSVRLPSWHEIKQDISAFLDAELEVDRQARSTEPKPLIQRQQAMWVLQNRPARPLSPAELDQIHSLPFTRQTHPSFGSVPAYRMIRHSVTIVRGCVGNCSFCSIARHQGPTVISRTIPSIIEEIKKVVSMPDFGGTITDLGGPTANLFGVRCNKISTCNRRDCLYPEVCRNLIVDQSHMLELLKQAARVRGVRHVFISSGLRMDLLLKTPELMSWIIAHHVSGAMKIAPEHSQPRVLRLMHKPDAGLLSDFVRKARDMAGIRGKKLAFNPYFISAHPGCTLDDMKALAQEVRGLRLTVRQFQDFTPTPGTISTAMYVTGLDRYTRKHIYVPRTRKQRRAQRKILEEIRGGR